MTWLGDASLNAEVLAARDIITEAPRRPHGPVNGTRQGWVPVHRQPRPSSPRPRPAPPSVMREQSAARMKMDPARASLFVCGRGAALRAARQAPPQGVLAGFSAGPRPALPLLRVSSAAPDGPGPEIDRAIQTCRRPGQEDEGRGEDTDAGQGEGGGAGQPAACGFPASPNQFSETHMGSGRVRPARGWNLGEPSGTVWPQATPAG